MTDIEKYSKWLSEKQLAEWKEYFDTNEVPVVWPESESLWNYQKVQIYK